MKEIQELQRQSNAAMKRLRTSENRVPTELDEVLSLLNARLRNLENMAEELEDLKKQVNRVPGSIPGDYTWDELVGNDDRRT